MKSLRRCLAASVLILSCGSPSLSEAQELEQINLEVQMGHAFLVDAVTFSADGKYAVTGAEDGRVVLWEVATGTQLRECYFSDVLSIGIKSVAISPGNEAILAGTQIGGVILEFEMSTGKGRASLTSPAKGAANSINSLVLSSGGRLIFAGEESGAARVWDSVSAQSVALPEHSSAVTAVALTPDNQLIGLASKDHTATLVAMKTGEVSKTLSGHSDEVLAIAFSRDGKVVVTGSADRTARVWDVASGKSLRTLTAPSKVNRVVFSKDGTKVYAQTEDSIVAWETSTGKQAFTIPQPEDHEPALAISPDGKLLLSSGGAALGRAAVLWDAATGERVRELSGGAAPEFSAKFSADGRYLGTGSQDGTAALWNLRTGHPAFVMQAGQKPIRSVDISHDGSYMLTGGTDGAVSSWSTETGDLLRTFRQPDGQWINSVAIAVNTKEILAGGKDGVTRIWNVDPNYTPLELKAAKGEVNAVAFSPKNDFVLSGGDDGALHQWLVGRAEPVLLKGHTHPINAITISSDARYAISTDSDECLLWNLESGSLMSRIPATDGASFTSVAFAPDEDQFVLGASDAAMIWKQSAKKALPLAGHEQRIQSVAFSPNSKFVVTASVDGTTRIWDAGSGTELATLVTFPGGWTVTDPSGRFDTNMIEGGAPLHWIVDSAPLSPLPLEIFMRDYFTPRLLPKLLGGGSLPEVLPLAKLNRAQPEVRVVSALKENDPTETVSVQVEVTNQLSTIQKDYAGRFLTSGVYDVRLFRNGQIVGDWPKANALEKPGPIMTDEDRASWRKSHEVELDTAGNATITFRNVQLPRRAGLDTVAFTAYAFNRDRVKSLTSAAYKYAIPAGQPPAVPPRAYLITMGVDANQSRNLDLDLAVSSADEARALLRAKLAAGGNEVVEIPLYSQRDDLGTVKVKTASKANLKAIFDLLAGRPVDLAFRDEVDPKHQLRAAGPDDSVILYVVSHGYADPQGIFYLMPYDTGANWGVTEDQLNRCHRAPAGTPDCDQPRDILAHSISSGDLAAWWNGVDAGQMVMILDSCHSGAVPGKEFRPGPLGDPGFGQLSYDKGMQILSASQSTQTEKGTVTAGKARTILVTVLTSVAHDHPQQTLEHWLQGAEATLPSVAKELFPAVKQDDVQLPLLLDFAKHNSNPGVVQR